MSVSGTLLVRIKPLRRLVPDSDSDSDAREWREGTEGHRGWNRKSKSAVSVPAVSRVGSPLDRARGGSRSGPQAMDDPFLLRGHVSWRTHGRDSWPLPLRAVQLLFLEGDSCPTPPHFRICSWSFFAGGVQVQDQPSLGVRGVSM